MERGKVSPSIANCTIEGEEKFITVPSAPDFKIFGKKVPARA
jgi:hypothetical protein